MLHVAQSGVRPRVLLVDDCEQLREEFAATLDREGFVVEQTSNGLEALELHRRQAFDLMVVDVLAEGMDGFALCDAVRSQDKEVIIVFLSQRGDLLDKRLGFYAGADDYLVKPVLQEELLLRVQSLLRRRAQLARPQARPQLVGVGDLLVDLQRHMVFLRGNKVALTPNETRIVALLAQHRGQLLSQEKLIAGVWGEEYLGTAISIPAYIHKIREKIEADPSKPRYLQTVWGCGYRLAAA
jgi:two-component system response regulator VicR